MIKLLVRYYSGNADALQKRVNERITRKFNIWVAEKKYCRPDIGLSEVAAEFEVSEEELSYFFSTIMGCRFSSIRKRLPLEESRRLINENPNMKIIQVANLVGIKDKCNFRKQFKETFNISPSEWQAECRRHKKIK